MTEKMTFKDLINSEVPVMVDFFAEWCSPCKTMAPILKDFASKQNGKVRVIKVDVDKNPAVAMAYRIQGVPTLILFKNGEAVWRQSGVVPVAYLEQAVKNIL